MTEEEAKTKWCPHIRDTAIQEKGVVAQITPSINSHNGSRDGYNCITSDCMMWQWDEEGIYKDGQPTEGHCGLVR